MFWALIPIYLTPVLPSMLLEKIITFIKILPMKVLKKFILVMVKDCQFNLLDPPIFLLQIILIFLYPFIYVRFSLSVSKFARDNCVHFEFNVTHCFVQFQATKKVVVEGCVRPSLCFFWLPASSFSTCYIFLFY